MAQRKSARTYKDAGVDFDAAEKAKRRIRGIASGTHGPEVLGGIGGFGGLFELSGYRQPVLVAGTDNVGTKLKIALAMGQFESLGRDVVNACVNDVIASGARPLFFLDYIAMGEMDADLVEEIVRGIAAACGECGCALIGGETSELPGLFDPGEFDLSGFAVGVVEKDAILTGSNIREGDLLVGIPSNGLHTNGFSLVRHALRLDDDASPLFEHHDGIDCMIGQALLQPHTSYYPTVRPVLGLLKGMAHVTGGGLRDNVPRMLPEGLGAHFDPSTWAVPPIFTLLGELCTIDPDEMYHVFNMGLGMVLACDPKNADLIGSLAPGTRVVGEVVRVDDGPRTNL